MCWRNGPQILSVLVLKKRMKSYQWAGVALVLVGTSIVGISAAMGPKTDSAPNPALGDAFIIAAQVFPWWAGRLCCVADARRAFVRSGGRGDSSGP